jgi:hypothetical protein
MSKNPFSQEEDNLQIWLKNSNEFKKLSQKEWIKSRQKIHFQSKFNIFMSTKNFFHKLNRTAVVGLGIVLFSTTVGVGAQIAAPNDFKPSQLIKESTKSTQNFSANKQADKNPYTALAPDENNYVANLENCDLALKFPKVYKGRPLVVNKIEYQDSSRYNIFYGDPNDMDVTKDDYDMNFEIGCRTTKIDYYINEDGSPDRDIKSNKLTVSQLREQTGWLITEGKLNDIEEHEKNYQLLDRSFSFNGKYYLLTANSEFDRHIQLQFNSLVGNEFSNDIKSSQ